MVATVKDVFVFSECESGDFALQLGVVPVGGLKLRGYFYFHARFLLFVYPLGVVAVCVLFKLLCNLNEIFNKYFV